MQILFKEFHYWLSRFLNITHAQKIPLCITSISIRSINKQKQLIKQRA